MPTIKDVAKKANVSVATVSRVLNRSGYVSEETRRLVEAAIRELDYIPNELARSLFKKQSKIIGVIVPHLSTYFFSELIEAIEAYFLEEGYHLMVFNVNEDLSQEQKVLNVFNQYNIDGLIVVTHIPEIENFLNLDIPILSIDHKLNDDILAISSDNTEGGRLAAKHLIGNGCANLLHIRGPSVLLTVQERTKGFNEIVENKGVKLHALDLDFRKPDLEKIKRFLAKHPEADGVFCDSDTIAVSTIRAAYELGKTIPEDIQVIGFDNIEFSELFIPSLTTIQQSISQLARAAYENMIALIVGEETAKKEEILPVKLIERESTRKKV